MRDSIVFKSWAAVLFILSFSVPVDAQQYYLWGTQTLNNDIYKVYTFSANSYLNQLLPPIYQNPVQKIIARTNNTDVTQVETTINVAPLIEQKLDINGNPEYSISNNWIADNDIFNYYDEDMGSIWIPTGSYGGVSPNFLTYIESNILDGTFYTPGLHNYNQRVNTYKKLFFTLIIPESNDDLSEVESNFDSYFYSIYQRALQYTSIQLGGQTIVSLPDAMGKFYEGLGMELDAIPLEVQNMIPHFQDFKTAVNISKTCGYVLNAINISFTAFQSGSKALLLRDYANANAARRVGAIEQWLNNYNSTYGFIDNAIIDGFNQAKNDFNYYKSSSTSKLIIEGVANDLDFWLQGLALLVKITKIKTVASAALINLGYPTLATVLGAAFIIVPVAYASWSILNTEVELFQAVVCAGTMERLFKSGLGNYLPVENPQDISLISVINSCRILCCYLFYANFTDRLDMNWDWWNFIKGSYNSQQQTEYEVYLDQRLNISTGWLSSFYLNSFPVTRSKWDYIIGKCITETNPLIVDFNASANNISIGQSVTFSDISSGNPTTRSWTFEGGNPSSSTEQNPTITYATSGNYSVTLTLNCNGTSNTLTKLNYINVLSNTSFIIAYEYWFDDNYSSCIKFSPPPIATLNLSATFPVSNLSTGLHTFHIRFNDNDSLYSQTCSQVFFYNPLILNNKNLVSYEYWFDNAYSSRIIKSFQPASNIILIKSLSTDALSVGLHTFNIRMKDNKGLYSSTISKIFYKNPHNPGAETEISSYRFFFDNNFSNQQLLQFPGPSVSQTLSTIISPPGLTAGNHNLYFQFQDNIGQWSSMVSSAVTVSAPLANQTVTNVNILNEENQCFNATQILTIGGNGSAFSVQSGGIVNLIAGQSIRFQPGSTVFSGGYLSGTITTSGQYCSQLPWPNQNQGGATITSGQTNCYNAIENLTIGGNGSTFQIQNGGTAHLIAGENINMLPNLVASSGSTLHAYISTDWIYCSNPKSMIAATNESTEEQPLIQQPSYYASRSFKIYPNPTTGIFTLEFSGLPPTEMGYVEIFGMRGEKVFTKALHGERKHEFSLSDKPTGVYFFRVITGDKAETIKIIKQ